MSIMTDRAKSIAVDIIDDDQQELISEYIDRELTNYCTMSLVVLCQEVQGEKYVFIDPIPCLHQDFDNILKELAHNALTFLVIQAIDHS